MENETKKSVAALREEEILKFWQDNDVFKKSLEKDAPKGDCIFYDGPPFATGVPHYGHILGGTGKDAIARYKTMRGFHVARRWGWDCHGLPIETIVEKSLGINSKKEIEEMGIERFSEEAKSKVLGFVTDWKKTVARTGRWVDFDGSYKTMDNSYIESVWWALGEMNKKGLIYEGVRVLPYCPRCQTPISNSEIAMDNSYKDITDISVYVKFPLAGEEKNHLLVWTTTPWSLPGDLAAAVNPEIDYVKVELEGENYILAKARLEYVMKEKAYKVVSEFKGAELVGKKYLPPFDYYTHDPKIAGNEKSWTVFGGDFVTTTDGTGIVHIAPAFGEDDMNLAKKENLPWIIHVTSSGQFKDEVTHFAGQYVKPKENHQAGDIEVVKYLAHNHYLFEKEKIIHSYPHCYRCATPVLYYALPSWFIRVQDQKKKMLELNEKLTWVPGHLKDGRFKQIVEGAPDWNFSRNRYWASPLPIWKSEDGKVMFVSSLAELKEKTKKSGNKYFVMRHGGTEGNEKGIVSFKNQANDNLTEKGKNQVRSEVGHYKGDIDLIIASPFTRTRETAEIACEELGLPKDALLFDDRLHEIDPGDFDGKSWDDYHNFVYNTGHGWYERKIPNGESLQEVGKRVGAVLYELEEKYKGKRILVVTHGGPAWLCYVVSGEYAPDGKEYQVANTHAFTKEFKRFQNAEIRELNFVSLPHNKNYELDFHRPYIDRVTLVDENGVEYKRIPEVIDCWFESGSMPFAQDHYPFERPDWQKENFPADFVVEYIAQTRTWFYYMLFVNSVLFGDAPFKNIVTTGNLNGSDGRKMSKSLGNYPDPLILIDKFGADPLRMYLISSVLMKGEDSDFMEKTVEDIYKKIVSRLDNVVTFYELYRDKSLENDGAKSENVLDLWILARLNELISESTKGMEAYALDQATRLFDLFVDDLSTWYLRRSRDAIKDGDTSSKRTLYTVLRRLVEVMAPFMPFTAEGIYQRIKGENDLLSVHLATWPEAGEIDSDILENMRITRDVCTEGNAIRKKLNIPVRQPLARLKIKDFRLEKQYCELIKDELNVKEVVEDKTITENYELDTNLTPELKLEGDYRELVRAVQELRKTGGLTPSDRVSITIAPEAESLLAPFMEDFKKTVLAEKLNFSDNDGEEIKAGDKTFKVSIKR